MLQTTILNNFYYGTNPEIAKTMVYSRSSHWWDERGLYKII